MLRSFVLLVFCLLVVVRSFAQNLPVELRMQGGHDHQVTVLTVSEDGKWLASGGYDRTLILWDIGSGKELRRIVLDSYVKAIDFSPDGQLLGCVTDGGSVHIYEVASGKKLRHLPSSDVYYRGLRFLPDGKQFITSRGAATATLWSLDQEQPLGLFEGDRFNCTDNCQRSMDVSPDGKWMIISNTDGVVTLWNVARQTAVRSYKHYPDIRHSSSDNVVLNFLPDSRSFIVGSEDEGILRWSIKDNQNPSIILEPQIIRTGLSFVLNDIAINHDGDQLAVLYLEGVQGKFQRDHNKGLHLYDLNKNEWTTSHDLGNLGDMLSIGFSPTSDSLFLAQEATPVLLNPRSGSVEQTFRGFLTDYRAPYWIMKATKKHLYLPPETVIERVGNQVISWSLKTGKPIHSYPPHNDLVLGMALNPDKSVLATGAADGLIQLSTVSTGDSLWSREMDSPVSSLAFTSDGQRLVTAHLAGRIILWDVPTGKYVRDLGRVADWYRTPMDIAFTSTGLISWGDFLMDTTNNERIVEFDGHEDRVHSVTVTNDGKAMLTSGWDGRVIHRELYYGGKETEIVSDHDHIYCAEFSPDEQMIAVAGAENRIEVFDLLGKKEFELTGHTGSVVSLTFTEDGKYLVSGSEDGSVKVWDLAARREIYSHVMLDVERWTTKVPSGHFYATQEGLESMFFVRGTDIYALEQFFEQFYQPKLTIDLLSADFRERENLSSQVASLPPPEVCIMYPGGGPANEPEVEVLVRVTDQGGGIDEVRMTHNGKLVVSDVNTRLNKSGKAQALKYRVNLVPGVNVIRAVAFSTARIESKPSEIRLTRPADEPTAACYVVAVGINEYKNPRLNLNYAVDDARSMVKLLESRGKTLFTKVEAHVITDTEATRERIIDKLESLSEVIRPTDVFYFFYAGHGSMLNDNFYFIPTNSTRLYEEAGLQAEALYVGDLVKYLKDIKALKQVLFIDACHSGGTMAILASRGAGEEKALAQLSRSAGVHILAAAGSDQTATEFADLGHGLFTYTVLEALSGAADGAPADDKVTVYELKSYLDDRVPEYSMRYKSSPQYPNTFSIGHDFPIVLKEGAP